MIGQRFGAYEITGHLGTGWMGELFAAVAEADLDVVIFDGLL